MAGSLIYVGFCSHVAGSESDIYVGLCSHVAGSWIYVGFVVM